MSNAVEPKNNTSRGSLMVIHTTDIDENNLATLTSYGHRKFMLVIVCDGEIDSTKYDNLKAAMIEYRMAVSRLVRRK